MEIRKLTSYTPAELNLVSGWMQAWWGEAGGYSPEQVRAYLLHAACENRIPQTYAAYHGGLLAGIYHIAMEDLFVRPISILGCAMSMFRPHTGAAASAAPCSKASPAPCGALGSKGCTFIRPMNRCMKNSVGHMRGRFIPLTKCRIFSAFTFFSCKRNLTSEYIYAILLM